MTVVDQIKYVARWVDHFRTVQDHVKLFVHNLIYIHETSLHHFVTSQLALVWILTVTPMLIKFYFVLHKTHFSLTSMQCKFTLLTFLIMQFAAALYRSISKYQIWAQAVVRHILILKKSTKPTISSVRTPVSCRGLHWMLEEKVFEVCFHGTRAIPLWSWIRLKCMM